MRVRESGPNKKVKKYQWVFSQNYQMHYNGKSRMQSFLCKIQSNRTKR